MGTVTKIQTASLNADGSYHRIVYRGGFDESWASIISSAGTSIGGSYGGEVKLYFRDGFFIYNSWLDIVFNLQEFAMLPEITAASLSIRRYTTEETDGNVFPTDNAAGIALVGQRETVRGVGASVANYAEIYQGVSSGELANRIPWSTLLAGPSNETFTFTLNAAGLAYLNSVHSKSDLPGYAIFGVVQGGVVDGAAPTAPGPYEYGWQAQISNASFVTISLTYSSGDTIRINVGDTWKDVCGIYLNQTGAAWQAVTDLNLNVADTWKDKV